MQAGVKGMPIRLLVQAFIRRNSRSTPDRPHRAAPEGRLTAAGHIDDRRSSDSPVGTDGKCAADGALVIGALSIGQQLQGPGPLVDGIPFGGPRLHHLERGGADALPGAGGELRRTQRRCERQAERTEASASTARNSKLHGSPRKLPRKGFLPQQTRGTTQRRHITASIHQNFTLCESWPRFPWGSVEQLPHCRKLMGDAGSGRPATAPAAIGRAGLTRGVRATR
jgi:hypothetical protein